MEPERLTLPASAGSLSAFCEFVRGGAAAAGIAVSEFGKLDLVLEEILINIARYAYSPGDGAVEVKYSLEAEGRLRVEIGDSGRVFNPLEANPPDLSAPLNSRRIGGLGLFLVREMVDSIDYRREDNRNILSFTFPRTSRAE